jgi:hypothetical protein
MGYSLLAMIADRYNTVRAESDWQSVSGASTRVGSGNSHHGPLKGITLAPPARAGVKNTALFEYAPRSSRRRTKGKKLRVLHALHGELVWLAHGIRYSSLFMLFLSSFLT